LLSLNIFSLTIDSNLGAKCIIKVEERGDYVKTSKFSSTEFAVKGSITKKTLRHYSKIGLLSPSTIDDNGYWYYDETDLRKLELIQSLKLIGLSLKEVKEVIYSDFETLFPLIDEKINYIDNQIEELQTAKRLLSKIKSKEAVKVDDAVKESIEEDHLEWLKENLDPEQLELVESMAKRENSYNEHMLIIDLIKDFRVYLASKNEHEISNTIKSIKEIYHENGLDNKTTKYLVTFLIKSSLNGPSHSKIINEEESIEFLNRF